MYREGSSRPTAENELGVARRHGLGEVGIGLVLLAYGVPGFVLGPIIGRGADRWGRRWLGPAGLGIAGLAAVFLILDGVRGSQTVMARRGGSLDRRDITKAQGRTQQMRRPLMTAFSALLSVLVVAPAALAQQTIEGTVASAKLTACEPKPGGCEGTLVLEPKGVTSGPVTIKVVKGTQITEGSKHLFLPGTNRRQVAITYVEDKGEKLAKSIEVKDAKR